VDRWWELADDDYIVRLLDAVKHFVPPTADAIPPI
jgi:hypothetical protein